MVPKLLLHWDFDHDSNLFMIEKHFDNIDFKTTT